MARILDKLHSEHIEVVQLLDLMSATLDRITTGDERAIETVHAIMHYMTRYPDMFHHPREDLLFARMIQRGAGIRANIDLLTDQHRALGRDGKVLLALADDASLAEALLAPGRQYIDDHRSHMNLEESQIFPLARVVLSSADWDKIDAAMTVGNDPLFGTASAAQYAALRRALSR